MKMIVAVLVAVLVVMHDMPAIADSAIAAPSTDNLVIRSVEEYELQPGGTAWDIWNQFYRPDVTLEEFLEEFCVVNAMADCSDEAFRHLSAGVWMASARPGAVGTTYVVRMADGSVVPPNTVTLPANVVLERRAGGAVSYALANMEPLDVAALPIVVAARAQVADLESQVAALKDALATAIARFDGIETHMSALSTRLAVIAAGIDKILSEVIPPVNPPLTVATAIERIRGFTAPEGWLFAATLLLCIIALHQRDVRKGVEETARGLAGHAKEAAKRADQAEALFAEADRAMADLQDDLRDAIDAHATIADEVDRMAFSFRLPGDMTRGDGGTIVRIPIDPRSEEVKLLLAGSDEPVLPKNVVGSLRRSATSRRHLGIVIQDDSVVHEFAATVR